MTQAAPLPTCRQHLPHLHLLSCSLVLTPWLQLPRMHSPILHAPLTSSPKCIMLLICVTFALQVHDKCVRCSCSRCANTSHPSPRLGRVGSRHGDLVGKLRACCRILRQRGVRRQKMLRLERCHAAGARRGDGLPPLLVLHIARRKHTWDVGLRGAWLGLDVPIFIQLNLALQEVGGWLVADGEEEAVDGQVGHLAAHHVLHLDAAQQLALVAICLNHHAVEQELNLGVLLGALLHDLGRAQPLAPVDDVDLGAILGEEVGLLHGAVAAADDRDGLVTENGRCAVAHRARADALVPETIVLVRARELHALGHSACGDDDCVSGHCAV
mmetsp:Transcript_2966/g.7278  ORF Transcript_2966/g.7278 Transcript_2966/m.7278 type:complete len:327 (-) Transcript_2966:410-1390(-)